MSREKVLCGKEEIVRIAVGIVDKEGMEALSVRRVAKELGVSSMTIYNYVENLRDIKKEVLVNGFDRLYGCIYVALNEFKAPVDGRSFCKTIAMRVLRFAEENSGIYMFMFSDGQRLFRGDAEIRPFYAFLSKLMKRSKATQKDWAINEKGYKLFEMFVFSIAYQYAAGGDLQSEEELEKYVDFFLERCIDSVPEDEKNINNIQ